MNKFLEVLKSGKVLLCDGAMGTELQKRGLPSGACSEEYNISHPEIIKSIHKDYFDAGSDIVETNTFGANGARLKLHGYEDRVKEFCIAAASIARSVCPNDKFVAGSVGPTGELLEPLGDLSEEEAYRIFTEQVEALEEGGVDVIFVETMMAAEEAVIATRAAKGNTSLPIIGSMTFELGKTGLRTMWGIDIKTEVEKYTEAGANVIGANCGKGFDEMTKIINEMRPLTKKPIIAQSNAGIPEWIHGMPVYTETPEVMAPKAEEILNAGVNILGGCCGTDPTHIKKMREILDRLTKDHILF
ncbi:MAG TPA: 5-methyltetrahydrofolate--homocysteine methyltransferase [Ignavibacteria bacterium]|nr:5-methyltetrahydrofolate--homocysteine methyltransferase [Ignavibacteria bacterium]